MDDALDYYEKAIVVQKDPAATMLEYLKAINILGSNKVLSREVCYLCHFLWGKEQK